MITTEPNSSLTHDTETTHRLAAALRAHPFLHGFPEQYLPTLVECAMEVGFASGEQIFREGDMANRFYLIESGRVQLETHIRDHGDVPIQAIGAGDVLGWSWLFPPYYWHFDARALEPVRAIFLYGSRLLVHCETDRNFGYELMKRTAAVLIQRLNSTRRELLKARGFASG